MNFIDISYFVNSMPGLISAFIPVAGYFISTWFSMGPSAYFRIAPSFCKPSLPYVIIHTAIGIVAMCITIFIVAQIGSATPVVVLLGLLSFSILGFLIMSARDEVSTLSFTFFWAALSFFIACSAYSLVTGHISIPGNVGFEIGFGLEPDGNDYAVAKFRFTVEELLLLLAEHCVLFFLGGVLYACLAKDYLVDSKTGDIILTIYSGERCLIGTARRFEKEEKNGKERTICVLDNHYRYAELVDNDRQLIWTRFYRVKVDRRGCLPSDIPTNAPDH